MSQKCHGVQAKRLNLNNAMQKPTQTSQTLLERWKNKKSFEKTKNTKENQTYQRKPKIPKQTKKTLGKTTTTKFLKVSDSPLDMISFFVVVLVFPKVFTKPTNPPRKPNIQKKTKENQTNIRENKKKQSV